MILTAGICLLMACSTKDAKNKSEEPAMETVLFKAEFTVWNESAEPSESCGDYSHQLIMVGNGNSSNLGKMTTKMVFCADLETTGAYGNGTGTFVADNGDELYFDLKIGEIILNEANNASFYPTRFDDRVNFTGGTGRFEGISGYFMTNAFVHFPNPEDENDVWHTDFFSSGLIILKKREL